MIISLLLLLLTFIVVVILIYIYIYYIPKRKGRKSDEVSGRVHGSRPEIWNTMGSHGSNSVNTQYD